MRKLRILSGKDVQKIFESFSFVVAKQRGSHMKFERIVGDLKQNLTAPNHKEIDRGTLGAIFRQASRFIPEDELEKHFYTGGRN